MIRTARPEDVPTIHALVAELARYEKLEHEAVGTAEALREHLFPEPGERGPYSRPEVLLAEEAGKIAGFAFFFHTYSTFLCRPGLYLEDLFVRPEHRRRGLGKALLQALARLAIERGGGRFEWLVLDWNAPAIAFYRSLGAAPLAEWHIFRLTGEALGTLATGSK